MTTIINVPHSLEDKSFELVLDQVAPLPLDEKIIVDTRHARWASPYGLTALLALAQSRAERPVLYVPEAENVSTYWSRMDFFKHAAELYELQGRVRSTKAAETSVLLEVTSISKSDDVHSVVDKIQQRAQDALVKNLNLDAKITMRFTMALSEVCQNIVEHAGRGGWVMVQSYQYRKRLGGRHVVVIAVCDAGLGFRRSLESSPRRPVTDRWDDGFALETAVVNGVSRYGDPGRGQGLKGIRGYVHRWDGKLSVRSGTARIALVPPWDDDVPRRDNLAPFAGAQLQITIPEKSAA